MGEALLRLFTRNKKPTKWKHNSEQGSSLLKPSRIYSASKIRAAPESPADKVSQPPAGYREVFSRQSNINLLSYSLLAMHSVTYDQLLPVFLHLPQQTNHVSNPNVHLPFMFAGGFGLDVLVTLSLPRILLVNTSLALVFPYWPSFHFLRHFRHALTVHRLSTSRAAIRNTSIPKSCHSPISYGLYTYAVYGLTSRTTGPTDRHIYSHVTQMLGRHLRFPVHHYSTNQQCCQLTNIRYPQRRRNEH